MFVAFQRLLRKPRGWHPFHEENPLKTKDNPQRTVTGILIPEKWDDKENVIGVSIQAFDENEYIVKSYQPGNNVFDFINEKVKVTGCVLKISDGKFTIDVNRFEVLDN
jgi:hypothetical protein